MQLSCNLLLWHSQVMYVWFFKPKTSVPITMYKCVAIK